MAEPALCGTPAFSRGPDGGSDPGQAVEAEIRVCPSDCLRGGVLRLQRRSVPSWGSGMFSSLRIRRLERIRLPMQWEPALEPASVDSKVIIDWSSGGGEKLSETQADGVSE